MLNDHAWARRVERILDLNGGHWGPGDRLVAQSLNPEDEVSSEQEACQPRNDGQSEKKPRDVPPT